MLGHLGMQLGKDELQHSCNVLQMVGFEFLRKTVLDLENQQ
jgi:hypothetical protein